MAFLVLFFFSLLWLLFGVFFSSARRFRAQPDAAPAVSSSHRGGTCQVFVVR